MFVCLFFLSLLLVPRSSPLITPFLCTLNILRVAQAGSEISFEDEIYEKGALVPGQVDEWW
jgi:hypothetical protein